MPAFLLKKNRMDIAETELKMKVNTNFMKSNTL